MIRAVVISGTDQYQTGTARRCSTLLGTSGHVCLAVSIHMVHNRVSACISGPIWVCFLNRNMLFGKPRNYHRQLPLSGLLSLHSPSAMLPYGVLLPSAHLMITVSEADATRL
ncbi:hypothetical protein AcW2_001062 [Taiwanofungus camphoratus]|nr:hypothetical protein AcW2_001062 [Antrodia cinnamomea]